MFGVMLLTFYKMREPAFLIIAALGLMMGYCVSEVEQFSSQIADNSILSQIVVSDKGGAALMTSSFFSLALTAILSIFIGASEIPRDIESGMILIILAKPLRKVDYMLGKYFGLLILCVLFFTGMELVILFSHLWKTGDWYSFTTMVRQFYLLLALAPLVAITVSLSCFFVDLAAMILSALYIIFSLVFSFIPIMVAVLPKGIAAGVESYLFVIYYFFPNYIFYFQPFALFGIVPLALALYSLAIAAIFLAIGAAYLKCRDLSPNG